MLDVRKVCCFFLLVWYACLFTFEHHSITRALCNKAYHFQIHFFYFMSFYYHVYMFLKYLISKSSFFWLYWYIYLYFAIVKIWQIIKRISMFVFRHHGTLVYYSNNTRNILLPKPNIYIPLISQTLFFFRGDNKIFMPWP